MIYSSKNFITESNKINLNELLCTEDYNIIFGNYESIDESFSVSKDSVSVLIRNRIRDGINGKPIPHEECTVKLVKDSYPMYENMKGLPFTINDPIKLYKDAITTEIEKLYLKKI